MIISTDSSNKVLLIGEGDDPAALPTEFNGAALTVRRLSAEQAAAWRALPAGRAGTTFDGATLAAIVNPPDFPAIKTAALAAIDAAAGAARARYITIAPGQEATYLIKADQATAFKAAAYTGTVPGLVQAEIDATGATAQQAADDILAQEAAWAVLAALIESARRRGKVAVAACANDVSAIDAAKTAAVAELGGL